MNNSHGRFQGKCHHCGKYGHREADCWEKHGRPGNNQAAEETVEQEEEVALIGFSLEADDEPQDNQDNHYDQDDQDDQDSNQVQDEPRPRETVVNCGRNNREQTQYGRNPGRRIIWNPRNHAGWGARPRNPRDWTTRPRPLSMGRSYINREGDTC